MNCGELSEEPFPVFADARQAPLRDKKMVRVIKRNSEPEVEIPDPSTPETQSITSTVNDWIDESRKNRINSETLSRKTIAGWAAEPKI
jgi:hypothetical protein